MAVIDNNINNQNNLNQNPVAINAPIANNPINQAVAAAADRIFLDAPLIPRLAQRRITDYFRAAPPRPRPIPRLVQRRITNYFRANRPPVERARRVRVRRGRHIQNNNIHNHFRRNNPAAIQQPRARNEPNVAANQLAETTSSKHSFPTN